MKPLRTAYAAIATPLYVAGIALQMVGLALKVAWLRYRLREEAKLYVPAVKPEAAYEKAKRDWSVN